MISLLIAITMFLALVGIVTSFDNPIRVLILSIAICCHMGALLLKRFGKASLTGLILIMTVEVSLFAMMLTAGGGHPDIEEVPLMDYLLISVVVAMAFFTPMIGLLVGVVNGILMFLISQFYPHGHDLLHRLSQTYWAVVLPPLILHISVTGVFFILMRTLKKESNRADSAEERAQLRQSELELRGKK